MADYLGWDAVLVRVGYVVLTVISFGAAGIILYLLAWMLIPLEVDLPAGVIEDRTPRSRSRTAIGVLLVIIGALALLDSFMPWFWHIFSVHIVFSALLIVLGLVVILWKSHEPAPSPQGAPISMIPEAPTQPTSARRLARQQRGRKIAGVCSGLGKHFGIDPTIVRLVFVALILAGGGGILLYLILWLVMPLELE